MTGFYERAKATADRLLTKFGRTISIVKQTGTPGAVIWEPGAVDSTTTDVVGITTNFKENQVDGELIRATDTLVLLPADVAVDEDDKLIVDGRTYDVVNPMLIQPGGMALLQKIQARSV